MKKIKENKKISFIIKNLNFWYENGNKQSLKNININIPQGETTALIGPSGCGKSTFLRTLNKMNDLIEGVVIKGSILFDENTEIVGKNQVSKNIKNIYKNNLSKIKYQKNKQLKKLKINKISSPNYSLEKEKIKMIFRNKKIKLRKETLPISPLELRTRVGMVFQKPNPFLMSIYDNVAYGPRSSGIKRKNELDIIVKEALENAALWDDVKNNLQDSALSLSGGQQQRLCIARVIAMKPEVILMDEPTSSLDPISTSKIEKLLDKLKRKFTIIIITHSMQQAARISDNTAFFYMGELIEFSATRKIFTNPKNKLTSNYITGKMG